MAKAGSTATVPLSPTTRCGPIPVDWRGRLAQGPLRTRRPLAAPPANYPPHRWAIPPEYDRAGQGVLLFENDDAATPLAYKSPPCPGRFVCPSTLRDSLIRMVEAAEHPDRPHAARSAIL